MASQPAVRSDDSANEHPRAAEPEPGTTILFRRAAETDDPEALDALVRRLEPMLFSQVAAKMGARLRTMFEVDDMTQSVLLGFLSDLRQQKFEWRGSAGLRANLVRRVVNKIRQRGRDQNAQKRNPGKLVSLPDSAASAAAGAVWQDTPWLEEEEELQSAIGDLLCHYRGKETVVKYILLSVAGCGSSEIEQRLGVTRSRVKQIERELREYVKERWQE